MWSLLVNLKKMFEIEEYNGNNNNGKNDKHCFNSYFVNWFVIFFPYCYFGCITENYMAHGWLNQIL